MLIDRCVFCTCTYTDTYTYALIIYTYIYLYTHILIHIHAMRTYADGCRHTSAQIHTRPSTPTYICTFPVLAHPPPKSQTEATVVPCDRTYLGRLTVLVFPSFLWFSLLRGFGWFFGRCLWGVQKLPPICLCMPGFSWLLMTSPKPPVSGTRVYPSSWWRRHQGRQLLSVCN